MADGPDCMRGCAGDGWRVRRAFAWLLSRWTAYLSCSRFLAGTRCGSAASPASAEMKNVRQGVLVFRIKSPLALSFTLRAAGGCGNPRMGRTNPGSFRGPGIVHAPGRSLIPPGPPAWEGWGCPGVPSPWEWRAPCNTPMRRMETIMVSQPVRDMII